MYVFSSYFYFQSSYMKSQILTLIIFLPLFAISQRITYSAPESEDSRALDFEVIGKVGGNFQVYKNIRNKYAISVYDNDMKLKERVNLPFMPDRAINVDFISYADYSWIIYQFQKRSVLHCMAVKLDANAQKIGDPIELDTTFISIFADNKIYSTINSEDKQKIMIYKIQKKNDKFNFTTILFNSQFGQLHKSRLTLPYDDRKDSYTDFHVDNEGNFIFGSGQKLGSRELIQKASLVSKAPNADDFVMNDLNLKGSYLDEIKIKIDNVNKHYILNSFFYAQKHGNIQGLLTVVWDKLLNKPIIQNSINFSDTLKQEAKTEGASRLAFNDYFIRNLVLRKDGGFILTAEDFYTQSRSNPWNRFDYLNGYPYLSSFDYYNSPSSFWYRPRSFNGSGSQNRYYYNNIVVLSIDKDGKLVWTNVVHKNQYDDDNDNYLSYQVMNVGGEIHFLFNELEHQSELIGDQSITPDGMLKRNPTLKSLDKGFQFMPRFAKQVSSRQLIVPCTYRNYICFAKIDYN